jgi:quinone-modifying oxidoreductase, subunit QmoC
MRETADPSLISEVRKYGVFNARGCFNCGSCTIVCDLAAGSASFPRRAMQSVVLGLKDSVRQSLDPWLCHDCGDCSVTCPREAKPRESMATLRRYLMAQYDWTGLSRRICRSPAWEIAALSILPKKLSGGVVKQPASSVNEPLGCFVPGQRR